MSLAAVPVYLLARRLSLSTALRARLRGLRRRDPRPRLRLVHARRSRSRIRSRWARSPRASPRSTARRAAAQLLFLVLAGLATFARVQYVVLPVAFVAAAVVVDRRRVLKTQRLPLVLMALPLARRRSGSARRACSATTRTSRTCTSAGSSCTGRASTSSCSRSRPGSCSCPARSSRSCGRAAARRPRSPHSPPSSAPASSPKRRSTRRTARPRFQERYLFALLPLVPIAFGLYVKHGRPARIPVALLSVLFFALSARVPLSGYAEALGKTDSPFLVCGLPARAGDRHRERLVRRSPVLAAAGAAGAVLVSRRGGGTATRSARRSRSRSSRRSARSISDTANARQVRHEYLPAEPLVGRRAPA